MEPRLLNTSNIYIPLMFRKAVRETQPQLHFHPYPMFTITPQEIPDPAAHFESRSYLTRAIQDGPSANSVFGENRVMSLDGAVNRSPGGLAFDHHGLPKIIAVHSLPASPSYVREQLKETRLTTCLKIPEFCGGHGMSSFDTHSQPKATYEGQTYKTLDEGKVKSPTGSLTKSQKQDLSQHHKEVDTDTVSVRKDAQLEDVSRYNKLTGMVEIRRLLGKINTLHQDFNQEADESRKWKTFTVILETRAKIEKLRGNGNLPIDFDEMLTAGKKSNEVKENTKTSTMVDNDSVQGDEMKSRSDDTMATDNENIILATHDGVASPNFTMKTSGSNTAAFPSDTEKHNHIISYKNLSSFSATSPVITMETQSNRATSPDLTLETKNEERISQNIAMETNNDEVTSLNITKETRRDKVIPPCIAMETNNDETPLPNITMKANESITIKKEKVESILSSNMLTDAKWHKTSTFALETSTDAATATKKDTTANNSESTKLFHSENGNGSPVDFKNDYTSVPKELVEGLFQPRIVVKLLDGLGLMDQRKYLAGMNGATPEEPEGKNENCCIKDFMTETQGNQNIDIKSSKTYEKPDQFNGNTRISVTENLQHLSPTLPNILVDPLGSSELYKKKQEIENSRMESNIVDDIWTMELDERSQKAVFRRLWKRTGGYFDKKRPGLECQFSDGNDLATKDEDERSSKPTEYSPLPKRRALSRLPIGGDGDDHDERMANRDNKTPLIHRIQTSVGPMSSIQNRQNIVSPTCTLNQTDSVKGSLVESPWNEALTYDQDGGKEIDAPSDEDVEDSIHFLERRLQLRENKIRRLNEKKERLLDELRRIKENASNTATNRPIK